MASRYEYILELTDKMSGVFNKIGAQGSKLFDKINSQQQKTIAHNERLNHSFRGLNSTIASIGISAGVFSLGKQIFNAGAEMETTRVSFEVLLGSLEKGNKMVKEISQYAAWSPYESAGLRENAKLMLGFQIAGEKVMPTIKMLGDVAMGNQEKLNRMTLAYSQMYAKGRLQAQDALQMIEAGFNPMNEIMKIKGWTESEQYQKQMEKGLISVGLVEKAFKNVTSAGGTFYNMAAKQSQTVSGRLSTLKDNWNMMLTSIGEKSNGVFLNIINDMITMVDKIGKNSNKIAKYFKTLIEGANNLFKAMKWLWEHTIGWYIEAIDKGNLLVIGLTAIASSIYVVTKAMAVWKAATIAFDLYVSKSALRNPYVAIAVGVLAIVESIMWLSSKTESMAQGFSNLWNWLVMDLNRFLAQLDLLWLYLKQGFEKTINAVIVKWYQLQNLLFPSIYTDKVTKSKIAILTDEYKLLGVEIDKAKMKVSDLENNLKLKSAWDWKNKRGDLPEALQNLNNAGSQWGTANPTTIDPLTGKPISTSSQSAIESTSSAISSGGSRPTNITINLQNLVGSISVAAQDLKEGVTDVERQVREAMLRVLNSVNQVAYD